MDAQNGKWFVSDCSDGQGHREVSCYGVRSLWPSVSWVPIKFPEELQILSQCGAESMATPDSPGSRP